MHAPRLLALLVACALAPAATSGTLLSGEVPAKALLPLGPQLYCVLHLTSDAPHRCSVRGSLIDANELRVVARQTSTFVLLDDVTRFPNVRQIATASCGASCAVPFPTTSAGEADLFIEARGAANGIVTVWAGRGLDGVLG